MVACDEVAMTYQGRQPRQTFIPAIGAQASPAAMLALGLKPNLRPHGGPGPMNPGQSRPPFAPHPPDEAAPDAE
jgi:hypothetical protein